ncbi:hypothetical protein [Streptomyces fractus]|uniref:hypothetical protein n=1 Tax=Streptomyces fractus TaxID=641806 RepID=UPI003CF70EBE
MTGYSSEQEELRGAVRQVLGAHEGPAAWAPLAGQPGPAGPATPEAHQAFGVAASKAVDR